MWADLDGPAFRGARCLTWLSGEERARAARFRRAVDGERWAAARAFLRRTLGRYLGCAPHVVALAVGPNGKPELGAAHGPSAPRFNLSHAAGRALLALDAARAVGIDVEHVDGAVDHDAAARLVCAASERAALAALPDAARRDAFVACWTAKEALLKGTGHGLSAGMREVEVSVSAAGAPRLLAVAFDPPLASRWSLHRVPTEPGYHATLAVEGGTTRLRCFAASC